MKIAICDDDLTELNRITAFLDEYSKTNRIPHRSFLVNMNFIRSIAGNDMTLANGMVIPLAQRRITEIRKHYLAFQIAASASSSQTAMHLPLSSKTISLSPP